MDEPTRKPREAVIAFDDDNNPKLVSPVYRCDIKFRHTRSNGYDIERRLLAHVADVVKTSGSPCKIVLYGKNWYNGGDNMPVGGSHIVFDMDKNFYVDITTRLQIDENGQVQF